MAFKTLFLCVSMFPLKLDNFIYIPLYKPLVLFSLQKIYVATGTIATSVNALYSS